MNTRQSNQRFTIGLLSENSSFPTESLIAEGVMRAAEEYDANVVYLCDLALSTQNNYDQLQRYIEQFEIDGLLAIGWSKDVQSDQAASFHASTDAIPVVSLGRDIKRYPYNRVSGYDYIKELTRHLIHDHHRKHIAYIRLLGRDDRQDGYIQAMEEAGLPYQDLIITAEQMTGVSDFLQQLERALDILFDPSRTAPDAIITLGAIDGQMILELLHNRGLHVPDDISVVCYEDNESLEYLNPPLTTIHYPFHELGYLGAQQLLRQLTGQPFEWEVVVPTHIIFRNSCGCSEWTRLNRSLELNAGSIGSPTMRGSAEQIAATMLAAYPDYAIPYQDIIDSFLEAVNTERSSVFLTALRQALLPIEQEQEIDDLQGQIDLLRMLLKTLIAHDEQLVKRADELWFSARYIIELSSQQGMVRKLLAKVKLNEDFKYISMNLLSAYNLPKIINLINDYCGWLQIPSHYLFRNNQGREELIFSSQQYQNRTQDIKPNADLRTAFQFYKNTENGRFSLAAMPLWINNEQIGFNWMDPGTTPASTLITFSNLIKTALKGVMLLEESQALADTDALTGLFNRRYFYQAIQNRIQRNRPFSLFFFDIDGFKLVNDQHGHHIGDMLLSRIAQRISCILDLEPSSRHYAEDPNTMGSIIFRLGGDEFTAMIDEVDPSVAAQYAGHLVADLKAPYEILDQEIHITCSIGIAQFPLDSMDASELLKLADTAMYKAKSHKNTYFFYSDMEQA